MLFCWWDGVMYDRVPTAGWRVRRVQWWQLLVSSPHVRVARETGAVLPDMQWCGGWSWWILSRLIACSHHYNIRHRSRYMFVLAVGYYNNITCRIKKQTSDVAPHRCNARGQFAIWNPNRFLVRYCSKLQPRPRPSAGNTRGKHSLGRRQC